MCSWSKRQSRTFVLGTAKAAKCWSNHKVKMRHLVGSVWDQVGDNSVQQRAEYGAKCIKVWITVCPVVHLHSMGVGEAPSGHELTCSWSKLEWVALGNQDIVIEALEGEEVW